MSPVEALVQTSQRVAIVTGGSGGIGRATAVRPAADDMATVVHCSGNQARRGTTSAITEAVAPGPTGTPLFFHGKSAQTIDRLAALNPSGRLGTPEDIAAVMAFLVSPGRWVNGQVRYANGGMA